MTIRTNTATLPASKKKKSKKKSLPFTDWWAGLLLPVVLIIIWETASRNGWVASHLLPAPTVVVEEMVTMGREGELWGHIGITLYRVLAGFVIGTAAAAILGVLTGSSKWMEKLLDPTLQALRAIPSLAWVPLFILWIGIGEASKITLVAVGVFFPVYLNLTSGIQGVDRKLIEVGRMYGFSTWKQVRKIVFPAAAPSFLTGIRSGLSLGWMFVVAAELLGTSQGLGYLMVFGQNTSSPELVIGSILLFAVFGKATDEILKRIERKSLQWQDRLDNSV
ncbi:ABC transporter permease [Salimicrobium flavidum]|uniref:Sulfonate transport system permease protein n=1 Tax=Salimicrobium flavidum TaxID=570947 RepID=A0A1N7K7G7_9BACI|nr:ABC transporter permease [Salimicrobium flavidum]SIS57532.1 sulfonate transport system permease protein [Salimicrobium flavidum]